jgi:hypothetical protein
MLNVTYFEDGTLATSIPPPGAVCPAMVRYGLVTYISELVWILPLTVKTQVRGPLAWTHARSEPALESLRFVTLYTVPPRPPTESQPAPSHPGNARLPPTTGQAPQSCGHEPHVSPAPHAPSPQVAVDCGACMVTVAVALFVGSATAVATTLHVPAASQTGFPG